MSKEHRTYIKAHNLIAKIVSVDVDMDDYPEADDAVIDAIYKLCEKHEDEAKALEAELEMTKGVHGNLINPDSTL